MKLLLPLMGLLPALALSQVNLDFQQGAQGQTPPGWFSLDTVKDAGYSAAWQLKDCRAGAPCVLLTAPANPPAQSFGNLLQSFDAAPYRGKPVMLRAWIRVEPAAAGDHAQMLLHVGRPNSQIGFVDNMANRPIVSPEWRSYEIQGEVAADAVTIQIGVMLFGSGRAWVGGVEFLGARATTSGAEVAAAHDAIQKQYARMDAAFVRGDQEEVARIIRPDAQIGVGTIRELLLPAIQAEMKKGRNVTARTTVKAVHLVAGEAVATVEREAGDPASGGQRRMVTVHRDTWNREQKDWLWRESIEISYHWLLPPTPLESVRQVSAELRARVAPVVLTASPERWDDLAAFGKAVGDARIVALGEAARGTREFPQLKQRLVEYLAKEKGFTILAAAREEEVRGAVDAMRAANGVSFFVPLEGGDHQTLAVSAGRLAEVLYPQAKIVLWLDNAHVRSSSAAEEARMGVLLRQRFGRQIYLAGFAFRRGEIRAVGIENGESKGMATFTVPPSPEGSGDAVLSSAGMDGFFLDMGGLPADGTLARWLAEPHLFHDLGAYWLLDDPDASLLPLSLRQSYDGIFYIAATHAGG